MRLQPYKDGSLGNDGLGYPLYVDGRLVQRPITIHHGPMNGCGCSGVGADAAAAAPVAFDLSDPNQLHDMKLLVWNFEVASFLGGPAEAQAQGLASPGTAQWLAAPWTAQDGAILSKSIAVALQSAAKDGGIEKLSYGVFNPAKQAWGTSGTGEPNAVALYFMGYLVNMGKEISNLLKIKFKTIQFQQGLSTFATALENAITVAQKDPKTGAAMANDLRSLAENTTIKTSSGSLSTPAQAYIPSVVGADKALAKKKDNTAKIVVFGSLAAIALYLILRPKKRGG
jgi:hypothetical protein